ncbi:MAG: hypothetical protein LBW85_02545 [Deltaproteobacteria bacterium]|jgi:hypothetical protein|nr:hypothetical protein [Deltaproteobacteria bacterium]
MRKGKTSGGRSGRDGGERFGGLAGDLLARASGRRLLEGREREAARLRVFFDPAGELPPPRAGGIPQGLLPEEAWGLVAGRGLGLEAVPVHLLPGGLEAGMALLGARELRDGAGERPGSAGTLGLPGTCMGGAGLEAYLDMIGEWQPGGGVAGLLPGGSVPAGERTLSLLAGRLESGRRLTGSLWAFRGRLRCLLDGGPCLELPSGASLQGSTLAARLSGRARPVSLWGFGGMLIVRLPPAGGEREAPGPFAIPWEGLRGLKVREAPVIANTMILAGLLGLSGRQLARRVSAAVLWTEEGRLRWVLGKSQMLEKLRERLPRPGGAAAGPVREAWPSPFEGPCAGPPAAASPAPFEGAFPAPAATAFSGPFPPHFRGPSAGPFPAPFKGAFAAFSAWPASPPAVAPFAAAPAGPFAADPAGPAGQVSPPAVAPFAAAPAGPFAADPAGPASPPAAAPFAALPADPAAHEGPEAGLSTMRPD